MASTAAGAQLTEQHRRLQLALRALTLRQVLQVWPSFDSEDVARSWPPVEAALMAVVAQRRDDSARIAGGYFQAFRIAEGISGAATAEVSTVDDLTLAKAQTSLRVTGYATTQRLLRMQSAEAAARTALVRVSGAVTRHVLGGGRETLVESVRSDRRALGWARATSGTPCHFCAMLASRGPVYDEDSGQFEAHDHCACGLEPVYRREQEWPVGSREYQRLWAESARGLSGADARRAFRLAVSRR